MYQIWFTKGDKKILFPIAPEKIEIKVDGANKTINLINESEVNQIKGLKLTTINFDLRLPNHHYPFALYQNGRYMNAKYFLNALATFKQYKTPFELAIIRMRGRRASIWDTVLNVTLESYTIHEDVTDGTDVTVSVELKQYVDYGTTAVKVKKTASNVTYTNIKLTTTKQKIATSYTTVKGDTFNLIAKKVYGKYTKNNAKALFIANKNSVQVANHVSGYLIKLGLLKKGQKANVAKRTDIPARIYSSMPFQKGVKLVVPQNKK